MKKVRVSRILPLVSDNKQGGNALLLLWAILRLRGEKVPKPRFCNRDISSNIAGLGEAQEWGSESLPR